MVVVQHCRCTKGHWIVRFQVVSFMFYELLNHFFTVGNIEREKEKESHLRLHRCELSAVNMLGQDHPDYFLPIRTHGPPSV